MPTAVVNPRETDNCGSQIGMVVPRTRDRSSSESVLHRISQACKMQDISESQLCSEAEVGRSQISATRNRGSSLTWPTLKALTLALEKRGFRRDWVLWGEGTPVDPSNRLNVGDGAVNVPVKPVSAKRRK